MAQRDDILTALRTAPPPDTITALAERAGVTVPMAYKIVSLLLADHTISTDDLPWRRGKATNQGRPRKPRLAATNNRLGNDGPLSDIADHLQAVINENGRDRVMALRELRELRTMGGAVNGPPAPESHADMLAALVRMLQSAGPTLTAEATTIAFQDANATQTPPNDQGPSDSRSGLD